MLKGKTILVTGGTGTFGNEFCKQALQQEPYSIRIYSRGEKLQQDMRDRFHDDRLRFLIGDVQDINRVRRAMQDVDIVVHAAALKHVPVGEYNPYQVVQTNVIGTANVIDAALDAGTPKVFFISSDKACKPVNLYGMTKAVGEKLMQAAWLYSKRGVKQAFSCVRYGNVIGSRGSVIEVWNRQKATGVITVTDARMTRYWLSIEQGVEFVMRCLKRMQGREIFVPKIPSMRIMDLADIIAPGCKMNQIGIRSGEKLHEMLMHEDESRNAVEHEDCYVIVPELDGNLPDGFTYNSKENELWLTKKQLKEML
jgi:UDP-N-acetylglucosamine 4,6-dehydratase